MKKLLLFLIIGIFMISLVSASIDKNFIKDETTNKYGKIEIADCGFLGSGCLLGFGTKLADLELKKNTDTCNNDCSAETEIILYKDSALIDSIKFLEKQIDGKWVEKPIKSYELSFKIEDGKNNSFKEYNLGDKVSAGVYTIKLEGEKELKQTIDWQITSQGKLIDDWAVWTTQQNSDCTNSPQAYEPNNFVGQTFTALGTGNISKIGIYYRETIINHNCELYINATSGGNPAGSLYHGSISLNNIQSTGDNCNNMVWLNITLNPVVDVVAGNKYFVSIRCYTADGGAGGIFYWGYASSGTLGYADRLFTTNYSTWTTYSGQDHLIGVWGLGVLDTTTPSIQIFNPTGIINYGSSPQLLNWSINDSALASVWYNYNKTNTTVYGAINSTYFTLTNQRNLTLYANDTAGNVNSSYVSWSYNLFENSQTYNSPAYEFSSELFKINISYDNSFYTSISANLVYDGVSYEGARQNIGSNTIISRTIGLPSVSIVTNKTFYWNISLTNLSTTTSFISNYYNQTVYPINFIFCNATYPTISLNFSLFDELTNLLISNSLISNFQSTFKYWIGGGINYKTYSFQNLTGGNNYQFCLSPNTTMYLDLDLQYKTNTYSEQTWYLRNFSISNQSQNINLYNLFLNESTKFNINIKQRTDYFTDATVDIYKYFTGEGIYKKVMVGLTDDKGSFVANLDLDQKYNFTIIKGGINYGSYEKTASCLTSPCEIDINVGDITLSGYVDLANYFAQYVIYNLSYNKNLSRVNLTFQDTLGTAQYWRLWVYRVNYGNDSIITICDEKSYSVSGTLSCDYTGYLGDLTAKVYVSRSPEKLVDFINFVNENATSILGTSAILASIIIILVVFFAGTRNPTVALILIPFALVLLKFIGFIPIGWGWIGALTIFCIWLANKMNT